MSSPAPILDSSTATAACHTMNIVTPSARASSASSVCSSAGIWKPAIPPRWLASAGRGRSTGKASSSGDPASAFRQYASWPSSTPSGSAASPSNFRCHSV
ncbi:hypothetical protein GCM10010376_57630 [Streptomyces violaceusniger]